MELKAGQELSRSNLKAAEAEMAKYGITVYPVEWFFHRQSRYTNLDDAIAQAKRNGISGPETSPSARDEKMAIYGIKRVTVECFHYRNYRYTTLDHALEQARRDERHK